MRIAYSLLAIAAAGGGMFMHRGEPRRLAAASRGERPSEAVREPAVESEGADSVCNAPPPRPSVSVEWIELANGYGLTSKPVADATIDAHIVNPRKGEATVTIRVRVEADGDVFERFAAQVTVGSGAEVGVPVDLLRVLPSDVSRLRFAAKANLFADVQYADGSVSMAASESLFFHAEAGDLLVYDESASQRMFGSGDFRNPQASADLAKRLAKAIGVPRIDLVTVSAGRLMTKAQWEAVIAASGLSTGAAK